MPTTTSKDGTKGAGFGPMYGVMRWVGERCSAHFFRDVKVLGGSDVPKEGPIIVCCTHFSTIMDVAIISAKLPHRRPIHYWAKRGLYKRQPFRWILENSGNIQVDRKTKNNQDLFAGTFKAMEAGEAIGLFPEGGSYTEHRLHSMKAGAAWAALEYAKHLVNEGSANPTHTELLIVPAAINYTDKSRFRGQAVFEFGPAFSVDQYTQEFLADDVITPQTNAVKEFPFHQVVNSHLVNSLPPTPGPSTIVPGVGEGPHPESRARLGLDLGTPINPNGPVLTQAHLNGISTKSVKKASTSNDSARAAVAKLTDRIGAEIYKMTIDAPDWMTWHSIKMARELIWKKGGDLPLKNLVPISNALVSILNAPIPEARRANEALCQLQGLVIASATDVFTLNALQRQFSIRYTKSKQSHPTLFNSSTSISIPTRAEAEKALPSLTSSAAFFLYQILALAIRLPYVAPLAAIYLPSYAIGWALSLRYASHEEESMASAKSLCAFVIAVIAHGLLIFFVAALFLFTPPGWLLGIALSFTIEKMHVWLLDETYDRIKLLVASRRLLAASLIGFFGQSQLAAEDRVTRIAVEVVETMPAIQFTFIKALRTAPKRESAKSEDSIQSTSEPSGLVRPLCSRMMGVTLQAHARAETALTQLFVRLKKLEDERESTTGQQLDHNTLSQWAYLRSQMEVGKTTKAKGE